MFANTRHLLLTTLAFVFVARSAPDGGTTVKSVALNGSGCPPGSASFQVANDSLSIILGSQYSPRSGPGLPLSGARRNCQVTLSLSVPAEWQFSVGGIEWISSINLDTGVAANFNGLQYFQGQIAQSQTSFGLTGPLIARNSTLSTTWFDNEWSSCGGDHVFNLNIAAQTRALSGSSGSGEVSVSTIVLRSFEWAQCPSQATTAPPETAPTSTAESSTTADPIVPTSIPPLPIVEDEL